MKRVKVLIDSSLFYLAFRRGFLLLHLQDKNKFPATEYVECISIGMNSGSGHNLDLSLGISYGSKGKDNEGSCHFLCNREKLVTFYLYSVLFQ
jgi:hypothetical protein